MKQEQIISPVSLELIKSELTSARKLRNTNKGGNEIYVVTYQEAPNVLREIGRLREIAFRTAGGGTGKSCDLDRFDTQEHPYYQLVVWDPHEELILGGYRFLPGSEWQYTSDGQPDLASSHMFRCSDEFIRDYAPYTMELGRSFVTLEYQSSRSRTKGIFALDNLWDGLGALTVVLPETRYFYGKMTMYPSFDKKARDMILFFLQKHFGDSDNLVVPRTPIQMETPVSELSSIFKEEGFKEDYVELKHAVRERGYNIPPLVNAYMGLSPTMRFFGTAINKGFGDVEETGIIIAVDEILEQKRKRHIDTFINAHPDWNNNLDSVLIRGKIEEESLL